MWITDEVCVRWIIAGVKSGEDPEEIVRRQLGLQEKGDLTEAEQQYVLKAKAKIEEVTSGFHIPGDKSLKVSACISSGFIDWVALMERHIAL